MSFSHAVGMKWKKAGLNLLILSQCRLGSHQAEGICWDRPQEDLCPGSDTNDLPWSGYQSGPGWDISKRTSFLNSTQYTYIHSNMDLLLSQTKVYYQCFSQYSHIYFVEHGWLLGFGKVDNDERSSYKLLLQPTLYGNYIHWIDRQKGIFKIVDSVKVATLWGKRKVGGTTDFFDQMQNFFSLWLPEDLFALSLMIFSAEPTSDELWQAVSISPPVLQERDHEEDGEKSEAGLSVLPPIPSLGFFTKDPTLWETGLGQV